MLVRSGYHCGVSLRVPQRNLRRWHVALATALTAAGHEVRIDFADCSAPDIPAFGALAMLEETLYRVPLGAPHDLMEPVGALAFSRFVTAHPPRVVFDCTAQGVGATDARVLVPDFDGWSDPRGLLDALLDGRPPRIGWRRAADGVLVRQGVAAIAQPHLIGRSVSETLGRLVSLASSSVLTFDTPGEPPAEATAPVSLLGRFASRTAANFAERLASRLTRMARTPAQWKIGWRKVAEGQGLLATTEFDPSAYTWLGRNPAAYVADPFPFIHQGKLWLFCEEFPYATGKGIISVAEVGEDGAPGPFRPVLECGYHLSYPAVFEREGQIFMLPETTANRTVELYRAEAFPDRWVLHAVLMEDISAADATLFDHGGRLWLAAATTDTHGTDRDALSLFHTDRLGNGFVPHPLNPVVVDVASARPAGWFEKGADGLLRRPAQDCTGGYGWGLTISRIDRLDRDRFGETVLARIPPPASLGAEGLHTVTRAGTYETIDAIL